jgi:hypothetical protein
LAILVFAFFAGRYCMHCCYAKPKPKPKGKDGKDGKTLTHTPSKKALRDPNAARAEAYAKVLRDPKTSRRKEAAKYDVEYAAETAAVQVAVRAAVATPPHREHEAHERRAKKEATALKLLPAPALPEAAAAKNDVEYAVETAAVQAVVGAAFADPPHREHEERERRAKKEATALKLLPAPALPEPAPAALPEPAPAALPEAAALPDAIPELFLPTYRAMNNFSSFMSQVMTARFPTDAPATEPANQKVEAPGAIPEDNLTV